jgi:hypothetical protein
VERRDVRDRESKLSDMSWDRERPEGAWVSGRWEKGRGGLVCERRTRFRKGHARLMGARLRNRHVRSLDEIKDETERMGRSWWRLL